ncbi:GNAT family N-acetyltransferase [Ciceribacter sp. L1K22]|uniref:GNAT family N-acetyltransferase n=1 Tax=Ciceribacter sp. L1K22 TaxID=2820275 RepID=UPI001ABD9EED|nr:GNAT family N-acetyltransferase [Ciceribacter sp. L1K22]MBO3758913.1 GNAT family N-acetyltransferase [Ciceribacter sp. L1K22]
MQADIILETGRLILRMPVIGDFETYAALMASSRSTGMGGPFDKRGAWGLFCHDVAQWQLLGHGALMVDLKQTGECVGQVGINGGPLFPENELGWLLYDGFEGRGIAMEAALVMRDWGRDVRGLPSLVSYVSPDNHSSIAVAERIGGVLDNDAARPEPDDLVFRHFVR